jgi:hypothetical protein
MPIPTAITLNARYWHRQVSELPMTYPGRTLRRNKPHRAAVLA